MKLAPTTSVAPKVQIGRVSSQASESSATDSANQISVAPKIYASTSNSVAAERAAAGL